MTEEVVNVRGEISDSSVDNGDRQPELKGSYCNGVSHVMEKKEEVAVIDNGNGDDKDHSDGFSDFVGGNQAVAVAADSGVSDLNLVADSNGAALNLDHKVADEARAAQQIDNSTKEVQVTVICEGEQINNSTKDCTVSSDLVKETLQSELVRSADKEVENVQSLSISDLNKSQDCENMVRAYADVLEDEKDVVTDVQRVTDVNGSHEFKTAVDADVRNGLADTEPRECAEKNEIPVGVFVTDHEVKSVVDADVQHDLPATELHECAEEIENPVGVDGVSAADFNKIHEVKSVVAADVQHNLAETELQECAEQNETPVDVDGVSATEVKKIHEFESVVGEDVQHDLAETELCKCGEENEAPVDVGVNGVSAIEVQIGLAETEVSESSEETLIPVDVNGVSAPTDVEESQKSNCLVGGTDEDAQKSSGEKAQSESVSVTDVNKSHDCHSGDGDEKDVGTVVQGRSEPVSVVGADVKSSLSEAEENEIPMEGEPSLKLERFEAESGHEPVAEGENLPALSSTDIPGDGNVMSDMNDTQEGSTADILDGQNTGAEAGKRPFYYFIRVPRNDDDENIKEQIKAALHQVEEKTKSRDEIRAEIQTKKARCKEFNQEVRAAISEERAARDLLKSKRQEMDSVQSTMNRLNNAISAEDIDSRIKNMEHMIEHETLPLTEEKKLLRQIKQLKQHREELSSNIGNQLQQSLEQKDCIEDHFKHLQLLKKEMELLRQNVLKTEAATKAARKKYDDECNKLSELLARFKAADDIRQEAYAKLQALRKQLYEKNKYFWDYKNAANKGHELASEGKKEELQSLCVNQVERIMELWNKNDEFRREYVRCNTRSTIRRLRTLDGRSLGPDEEPPVIPNALAERASKNNCVSSQSTLEQENKSTSEETVNTKDEPVPKVVVQKSQATKAKKPAKPGPLAKSSVVVSSWDEAEDVREEPERTKEEEEQILKAEKLRKEEEEAQLKEKRRLEEIEKAKEAMQRKKRNADRAQQRAALKAQREAEQKEKEREKRARKKERKKAATATDTAENAEEKSAFVSETLTESTEECDQSEKPVEISKRLQKPSQFTRQTKAKSIPPPLRNRGKRRIQSWMWVLLIVLAVVALFYMGNNSFFSRSGLQGFGF